MKVKETFRTFIAIPVSSLLKQQINTLRISLTAYLEKNFPEAQKHIKWIPDEKLHVTLKFLGDISSYQANEIMDNIKYLATNVKPFKTILTSLIGFPSLEEPDVLALSPYPQPPIIALAYKIDDIAKEYGISPDKQPYRPHLSIARVEKSKAKLDLSKINIPKLRFSVDEIRMYQSDLATYKDPYKLLGSIPLS